MPQLDRFLTGEIDQFVFLYHPIRRKLELPTRKRSAQVLAQGRLKQHSQLVEGKRRGVPPSRPRSQSQAEQKSPSFVRELRSPRGRLGHQYKGNPHNVLFMTHVRMPHHHREHHRRRPAVVQNGQVGTRRKQGQQSVRIPTSYGVIDRRSSALVIRVEMRARGYRGWSSPGEGKRKRVIDVE